MSGTMINQFSAIAVRVETTAGTDVIGGTPAASDQIFGSVTPRINTQTVDDPSLSGALDAMASMVTGTRPTLELSIPMRGSGTAGTAPVWGALLRACSMSETVDATGVVATAATAGTATTATFGVAFSNTAQFYRGIAGILTGNPVGPVVSPIIDWTTGRVATFGETFSPVLSTSTQLQIPANVVYRPVSDPTVARTVTIYVYRGGYRWRFVGGMGTARVVMRTGGIPMLMVTLQATLLDQGAVAIPAALTAAPTLQPPVFLNARSRLLGALVRVSEITADLGNQVILPENPEALEGVDPAVITGRRITYTLDPLIDTTVQATTFTSFRAGTTGPLFATVGTTAGNRMSITSPSVRRVEFEPGDRQGLGANSVRAQATGADNGLIVCCY